MPTRTYLSDKDKILKRLKAQTEYKDNHWLFTGRTKSKDGYCKLTINKRRYSISRLSAYIHLGLDINDLNLQANHKIECTYKNCWNPNCLYVGTHSQNMTDQVTKGEHGGLNKTHCPQGHRLDGIYRERKTGKRYRYCKECTKQRMRNIRGSNE